MNVPAELYAAVGVQLLGRASMQGGIALLIAWVACRTIPRLSPSFKCWIWRLAYLKLLVALLWMTPVPLRVLGPASAAQDASVTSSLPHPPLEQNRAIDEREATSPNAAVVARPADIDNFIHETRRSLSTLLFGLWCCGVLAVSLRTTVQWRATRRLRSHCGPPASVSLQRIYQDVSERLSIHRPPPLLTCENLSSPLLLGMLRPVIVVPIALDGADRQAIEMMLAHELAHFRRQDTRWALLPLMARIAFWFHPLVWLAERELGICQESACDQAAVAATRCAPVTYGGLLLRIADQSSNPRRVFAVGVVNSRSTLHRRLSAMRYFKSWSLRHRIFAASLLAFIGACGLVPWKLAAQQTKPTVQSAASPDAHVPPARDNAPAAAPRFQTVYPGYLITDSASVRASRDGVVKVFCKDGDIVKKRQLLVQFDAPGLHAAVTQAEAQLHKDHQTLNLVENTPKGVVSQNQREEVRAAVEIDAAQVEARREELESTKVLSPLDGAVINQKILEGTFVSKGGPMFTIVSLNEPKVVCDLPAELCPTLQVGQGIQFKTTIYPQPFSGKISFISPQFDPRSNTFPIKATLDDPEHKLRPGLQGVMSVVWSAKKT